MNRELQKILLKQREEENFHISIETEFLFYRRIAMGDMSVLEGDMDEPKQGQGKLSKNPLQNLKYHLVILTAMITRFCIEEGLDSETAYTMSDLYILEIDSEMDKKRLKDIKYRIVSDFVKIMAQKKKKGYSYPVVRATEYIENNLTDTLTNQKIAKKLCYNEEYLSKLFKKETGQTLARYVLERKCHTACYLLLNSESTCTDISNLLGFSSCSHFIARFRKIHGTTPEKYRREHMRMI